MTNLSNQQKEKINTEVTKQLSKKFKLLDKSKQTVVFFHSEFKSQVSTALIAAFGFLIALAWRDFISKIVQENTQTVFFAQYPYLEQLISALIVTLIGVIGIALITRWAKKPEKTPDGLAI